AGDALMLHSRTQIQCQGSGQRPVVLAEGRKRQVILAETPATNKIQPLHRQSVGIFQDYWAVDHSAVVFASCHCRANLDRVLSFGMWGVESETLEPFAPECMAVALAEIAALVPGRRNDHVAPRLRHDDNAEILPRQGTLQHPVPDRGPVNDRCAL